MGDSYVGLRATQKRFLACFAVCASITQSARWAKVHRQTHYDWLRDEPEYAAAFALAEPRAMRALEDEAVRRAREGIRRAVRYKGKIVGYETEYSYQLLVTLLKGGLPGKYRERFSGEITGAGGGPIEIAAAILEARRQRLEAPASNPVQE